MIKDKIITPQDIALNDVSSAPTRLPADPVVAKQVFDKLPELIAGRVNAVITDLNSITDGATNIGSPALKPNGAVDVGGQLAELSTEKVDKITNKGLSERDFTQAYETKLIGIEPSANNYSLPTASTTILGGIKVDGISLVVTNGVASSQSSPQPDLVARAAITQEVIDRQNADNAEATTRANADNALDGELATKQTITDNSLLTVSKTVPGAINEVFTSASNGKVLIADAITGKNLPTSPTATYQVMADNIGKLGDYVPPYYLYNSGDEITSITGGWAIKVYQSAGVGLLTKESDNLYLSSPKQDSSMIWVSTSNAIDVTNYKKMKVELSIPVSDYEAFGLSNTNNTRNSFVASYINDKSIKTRQIIELDITSITGSKYPILATAGSAARAASQMHVYKIWLK